MHAFPVSGSFKVESLTLPALVSTLDRLLELEVSWMAGNSLPQTVFTCLFVDRRTRRALRMMLGLPELDWILAKEEPDFSVPPLQVGTAGYTLYFLLYAFIVAQLVQMKRVKETVMTAGVHEVRVGLFTWAELLYLRGF